MVSEIGKRMKNNGEKNISPHLWGEGGRVGEGGVGAMWTLSIKMCFFCFFFPIQMGLLLCCCPPYPCTDYSHIVFTAASAPESVLVLPNLHSLSTLGILFIVKK